MEYNSQGLVTRMVSPNELITTYTYNDRGLMVTKIETPPSESPGNVRIWRYEYFPTGLLQTETTPVGVTINYQYDAQDRVIKITAANGVVTSYEYDIINRKTKEISPDRGTISYSYDWAIRSDTNDLQAKMI